MINEYDEYHDRMKKEFLYDMESAQMLIEEAKYIFDKEISIDTALQYVMHHERNTVFANFQDVQWLNSGIKV